MIELYEKDDTIRIFALRDYLDIIKKFYTPLRGLGWIYRGQSNSEWKLIPKAGRKEFYGEDKWKKNHSNDKDYDLKRFYEWKEEATPYLEKDYKYELELLALAQHYGLATRLLDWSTNPLIALFFAVNENNDSDGIVYCYLEHYCIEYNNKDFRTITDIVSFKPRAIDKRIQNQKALFTYHPYPNLELKDEIAKSRCEIAYKNKNLGKIFIDKKFKNYIIKELSEIGIDYSFVFPDLDGISKKINHETMDYLYD